MKLKCCNIPFEKFRRWITVTVGSAILFGGLFQTEENFLAYRWHRFFIFLISYAICHRMRKMACSKLTVDDANISRESCGMSGINVYFDGCLAIMNHSIYKEAPHKQKIIYFFSIFRKLGISFYNCNFDFPSIYLIFYMATLIFLNLTIFIFVFCQKKYFFFSI